MNEVWSASRAKGGPNSIRAHEVEVMQTRPAQSLCMDHTFEVAKRVRSADGSQTFVGLFSVMNERVSIAAQQFVKSKSMDEVVPMLEEWRDNQLRLGNEVSINLSSALHERVLSPMYLLGSLNVKRQSSGLNFDCCQQIVLE